MTIGESVIGLRIYGTYVSWNIGTLDILDDQLGIFGCMASIFTVTGILAMNVVWYGMLNHLDVCKINGGIRFGILIWLQDLPSKLYFCGHKSYLPTTSHRSNFIAVSPCEIKSWKYCIGHLMYEEHKKTRVQRLMTFLKLRIRLSGISRQESK